MNQQYRIRHRIVEVSTSDPSAISADAILLPWTAEKLDDEPIGLLKSGGERLLEELDEYPCDRDVLITSAGKLNSRFLFHLTLPTAESEEMEELQEPFDSQGEGPEYLDLDVLEDRFRDAFFQATLLGLTDLAIPVNEFSVLVESFSGMISVIWRVCSDFLAQDKGPRSIIFLVNNRDLQGQYLSHFFKRKQLDDSGGNDEGMLDEVIVPRANRITPIADLRSPVQFSGAERVLTMKPDNGLQLDRKLNTLIDAYRHDVDLDPMIADLQNPMLATFTESLCSKSFEQNPPNRLRILGATDDCRLPWELLSIDGSNLADEFLFTRGTNFLHFNKKRPPGGAASKGISFRIAANQTQGRPLAEELQEISKRLECNVNWNPGARGGVRVVHCIGLPAIKGLLAEEDLQYELIYLDLEPGEEIRSEIVMEMDEWAKELLTRGCRRVIAPLVSFRNDHERRIFRSAFYERLLGGNSAGHSLQSAQGACKAAFGKHSGWFLNRIFGQTDEVLVSSGNAAGRQGNIAELISR
ncbi:MAG: hypothetical protein GY835_12460 [bacterium]|nr:hypothetical protein [bacterium]